MKNQHDIFSMGRLYPPEGTPIKLHYKDFFDTIFIALSPFFKMDEDIVLEGGHQKSEQISFAQLQQEIELFRGMPRPVANIYAYNNKDYPDDGKIYKKAIPVSWRHIINACGFQSYGDVYKALKTSIGAYKPGLLQPQLANTLSKFVNTNSIYCPVEGRFEVLSKKQIFKSFRLLHIDKVTVEEEFGANKKELDLARITEQEFVESIKFKDYFIYDQAKTLLFAVDWDDFFFLVCSNLRYNQVIREAVNFEGFICDETTEVPWEFTREELQTTLENAPTQHQLRQTSRSVDKKPWWKVW